MKRILVTFLLAAVVSVCLSAGVSAQSGSLMKPSSINLPYGSTITTEINLTENDLLPTIKSLIPMIGELAKMGAVQQMGASMAPGVGEMGAQMMSGLDELDTTQLAAAVEGVKVLDFDVTTGLEKIDQLALVVTRDLGAGLGPRGDRKSGYCGADAVDEPATQRFVGRVMMVAFSLESKDLLR